jgi:hypothetical protein
MTDNSKAQSLTPSPSPAGAGEGSIVTEMVDNHFRKAQWYPIFLPAVVVHLLFDAAAMMIRPK